MATSTEQINDLIGACTDLKQYFQGAKGDIEAALTDAASAYQDKKVVYYVDQAQGDDANAGTQDAPVASIQTAIDKAPYRGWVEVRVRGHYKTHADRLYGGGRTIEIVGRAADWGAETNPANYNDFEFGLSEDDGKRFIHSFDCGLGAFWDLSRFNVILPSTAVVTAALPGAIDGNGVQDAIFTTAGTFHSKIGGGVIRYSDIHVPPDYYGKLVGYGAGYSFFVYASTVSGTGTLDGEILSGVAAGADPALYGHLLMTNLSTL